MEDDAPVIYGLESQARAITAQVAETEAIRFLVGTQSLRSDNQVHLIDFDDENNLINKTVYSHSEGEIWDISASSKNKNIFATCYNKTYDNKCETHGAIWKLPEEESSSPSEENMSSTGLVNLELLCKLPTDGKDVKCINWNPCEEFSTIISVVDNKFQLWDLNESSSSPKLIGTCVLDVKGQPKFNSGRWNPHQKCSQFGTVNDTSIRGWDLRTMQQTFCIENAHCQLVRDIDFNPNKQYYLASCGDDCYTKFWDVRNTSQSLLSVSNHSHWVWKVRFNHFHDQLILTSSSDSRVILSSIVSLSSEPFGHLIDEENEEDESRKKVCEDGVISTYEEHEDSVYALEWSVADPWIFASLSYDGRLVINRVPRSEKYKILL